MKLFTKLFKGRPSLRNEKSSRINCVGLCNTCTEQPGCKTYKLYVSKHKDHKFIKSCSRYSKACCENCGRGTSVLSEKYNTKSARLIACNLKGTTNSPHNWCGHHLIGGR